MSWVNSRRLSRDRHRHESWGRSMSERELERRERVQALLRHRVENYRKVAAATGRASATWHCEG